MTPFQMFALVAEVKVLMAKDATLKNLQKIEDLGDLPFEAVKPLLNRVKSARQLALIEDKCPQLIGQTADAWRLLMHKTFRIDSDKVDSPASPRDWRRVYDRTELAEHKKRQAHLSNIGKLRASLEKLSDEREAAGAISLDRPLRLADCREPRPDSEEESFPKGTRKEAKERVPRSCQGRVAPAGVQRVSQRVPREQRRHQHLFQPY